MIQYCWSLIPVGCVCSWNRHSTEHNMALYSANNECLLCSSYSSSVRVTFNLKSQRRKRRVHRHAHKSDYLTFQTVCFGFHSTTRIDFPTNQSLQMGYAKCTEYSTNACVVPSSQKYRESKDSRICLFYLVVQQWFCASLSSTLQCV